MRATPRTDADASVSALRRSMSVSPGRRSSGTSPYSPLVATTSTARLPSAAARAIVPPVLSTSSSGWAWKKTNVGIRPVEQRSLGCANGDQLVDRVGCEAPVGKHLAGVLTGVGRQLRHLGGSAREPRCRCRLHHAADLDEGAALDVVRVLGRLLHP